MDNIENILTKLHIAKVCNICKNNNTIDKNICANCQTKLTLHFPECNCIYCR